MDFHSVFIRGHRLDLQGLFTANFQQTQLPERVTGFGFTVGDAEADPAQAGFVEQVIVARGQFSDVQ